MYIETKDDLTKALVNVVGQCSIRIPDSEVMDAFADAIEIVIEKYSQCNTPWKAANYGR